MARGFFVNVSAGTAIDAVTFTSVPLQQDIAEDAKSSPLPQSCKLAIIELQFSMVAGGAANLIAYLSWDTSGHRIAAVPITQPLTQTGNGTRWVCSQRFHLELTAPAAQTTPGRIYLCMKTDAGTARMRSVAVQWTDNPVG